MLFSDPFTFPNPTFPSVHKTKEGDEWTQINMALTWSFFMLQCAETLWKKDKDL